MSLKAFRYGGYEGVLDFTDFAFIEKFETALKDFDARLAKAAKQDACAAQLKGMFEAVVAVFEATLGEGGSNAVLGESTSMDEAMKAFNALVAYRQEQDKAIAASWKQVASKYSPKVNRADIRAAQ